MFFNTLLKLLLLGVGVRNLPQGPLHVNESEQVVVGSLQNSTLTLEQKGVVQEVLYSTENVVYTMHINEDVVTMTQAPIVNLVNAGDDTTVVERNAFAPVRDRIMTRSATRSLH